MFSKPIPQYEDILSTQSVGIVHHMELFHCDVPPGQEIPYYNAPCNSEMKPLGLEQCRKVLAAWAMGAKVSLRTSYFITVGIISGTCGHGLVICQPR